MFFYFRGSQPRGGETFVVDCHKVDEKRMTCKGICTRHKAQKPVGAGRYASGQKRCQICEIFIKWEGLWCPCCGYRLRTKPRNLKYKAKLRTRMILQEARRVREVKPALLVNQARRKVRTASSTPAFNSKASQIGKATM